VSEIRLAALKSGVPMGFMAALGAFRHAVQMPELGGVKLKWEPYAGQWRATLVTGSEVNEAGLVRLFVERVKGMAERPEFAWSDQIKKTELADFRRYASHPSTAENWFAAFGTELSAAKDGTLRSTPFDMTGGQQKFLLKLRQASEFMAAFPDAAGELFREALFGPWQYKPSKKAEADNSHSLGLDPATLLQGAFTGDEPSGIKDKRGVRGAIWLAFESLPLFPCVYDAGLRTVGFIKEDRALYFQWSVWESPLSLETVRTLLMQSPRGKDSSVAARFRCERVNLIKDYYAFSSAELIV
jgi:hypothetical protein